MSFKKFEDLPVWQDARILSKNIYGVTCRQKFRDFCLRDQMRRSVVSIASNIAEGFERGSNKEFIQFLYISKGSLGELRSQIYLSYDNNYIDTKDFDDLIKECFKLSSQISNFIKYLRNSNFTKLRHKTK